MEFQDIQRERDRLKGLLSDYENRKQMIGAGENIAQAFSSVPTLGEAMGKTTMRRPEMNFKGLEGEDPREQSKQNIEDILTQYKMGREKKADEVAIAKRDLEQKDLAARGGMIRKLAPEYGLELGDGAGPETYKTAESMIKNKQDLEQKKLSAQRESDWRQAMLGVKGIKEAEKVANKNLEMEVPGYDQTGAVRPQLTEVKALRNAAAASKTLLDNVEKMKNLVSKYGSFEAGGVGGAEMKALARDIQLDAKNEDLYKLGVLTGKDLNILEDIIADPSSISSLFTRDKTRESELDTFTNSIKSRLKNKAETLGYADRLNNKNIQNQDKRSGLFDNAANAGDAKSKPKALKQGGVTFYLNESTGEYE
jgi:hypothetical protein